MTDPTDQYEQFYHDGAAGSLTPEQVLAELERLCGPLSEDEITAFRHGVDEYAQRREAMSRAHPPYSNEQFKRRPGNGG